MTILKPCPFCGGPAQVASGGPGLHYVRCEGCTASTDDGSRERAIALWNNREAAEARAREEGAKAMHIELAKAANACMNEYKRGHADGYKQGYNAALAAVYNILHKCGEPCPQCHDAIAALDPAQIAGGKP